MKISSRIKLFFLPSEENNFQPHIFKSNLLFYYLLILFVLRVVILPFYYYFPKNAFFAEVISTVLINLTNQERQTLGLPSLKENPILTKATFLKAQDILANDYFAHKSPTGITGWYWIEKAGYNYEIAGENLAIGFLESEEVHEAWINSLLHKKNILNPEFQDIGITVLEGDFQGNKTTVVVQFFGSPKIEKGFEGEVLPSAEAKEEISGPMPEGEKEEAKKETLPFQFNFLEFMAGKYNSIITQIIFYSLVLITIILIFNIFILINFSFRKGWSFGLFRGLIPGIPLLLGLLFLLFIFTEQFILSLIPHTLRIYGL